MKFAYIAIAALLLGLITGCGDNSARFRIQTPYGNYDGTTSNTIDLDLRPYLPPAKTYTPESQLEK